jgi:hypothetical protein
LPEYVSYPVETQVIPMWEEANNIKINVFVLDEFNNIKIEYHSSFKTKNVCNLLLYKEHYVWIKNLDRFDASSTSKNSIYRCSLCLAERFSTKELLEKHIKKCICDKNIKTDQCLPEEKDKIKKFTNFQNEFMHQFHIVADFESTLEEVKDDADNNTQKYKKHVANSYGLKYNCIHKEYSEPVRIYNNNDPKLVIKKFIETIEDKARDSYKLMRQNISIKKIIITDEQNKKHDDCVTCSRCECKFDEENKKVKHHDHIYYRPFYFNSMQ